MRVNVMNVVIGAGVGVLDEFGEKFDSDRGNTKAFAGVTGWSRVGVALVSYAGQMLNVQPRLAETIGQSVLPLATKTVVKSIIQASGGTTAARPRTNRATSTNLGGGKVAWKPVPIDR